MDHTAVDDRNLEQLEAEVHDLRRTLDRVVTHLVGVAGSALELFSPDGDE